MTKAVLSDRRDAQETIDSLRGDDLLDPERRIVRRGNSVAVPVVEDPGWGRVVEQSDPVPRNPDPSPREALKRRGVPEDRVPSGWTILGDVLLADLDGDGEVAEVLLEAHSGCDSVLDYGGVEGSLRRPDAEVLAGSDSTVTVHRENGFSFRLDPSEVMFSPGNSPERLRVKNVVEWGERVLDMFACVGQFSVPAACAGARVLGVDANPVAVQYLRENSELNGVGDRLDAVVGDSSTCSPEGEFDRVLMGHLDSPGHLGSAVRALDGGGWIHYHEACPEAVLGRAADRVREAVSVEGRSVSSLCTRRVKSFSPGVVHVVVDCLVE